MTGAAPARPRRALALGVALIGGAFCLLQRGNPMDEGEHLHAAWLVAHGQRPIHDFFEHHTPLLWQLLQFIFRAGVDGPESLYVGRLIALACVLCFGGAVVAVARRWSGPGQEQRGTGLLAMCLLALILVFEADLFVVRPETLATALCGLALLSWTAPARRGLGAAGAGAAFALSVCASPRFLLLAPLFPIADLRDRLTIDVRKLAIAAAAGGAVVVCYVALFCPLNDLLFDVRFSALLQQVGIKPDFDQMQLCAALAPGLLLAGHCWTGARVPRAPALAWLAHGALVGVVCVGSAGKYLYAQAVAPFLVWFVVFLGWLEARPARAAEERPFVDVALASTALVMAGMLATNAAGRYAAVRITQSRRMLLDALAPGSRVFLLPTFHPIAVADASYWGTILIDDSPGKLCETVDLYRSTFPDAAVRLPDCDFAADLKQNRPAVVSRTLPLTAERSQFAVVTDELQRWYGPSDAIDDAPTPAFSANVYFLRTGTAGQQR